MYVAGMAGYSGAGKTTLLEQLIPALCARGQRVSVIKHTHHHFDIDHPGKDTYRHRQAGAYEVLACSDRRMALMREFAEPREPEVHALLRELDPGVDWVLVEGFRHAPLPKVEIWRAPDAGVDPRPALYPHDPHVLAVATDNAARLPMPPRQPVLDLNAPAALADWLLAQAPRFAYSR